MGMADMSLDVMAYQLRKQWENATKEMLLEELIRVKATAKWDADKIHSLVRERNEARQRAEEAGHKLMTARKDVLDLICSLNPWIDRGRMEQSLTQIEQSKGDLTDSEMLDWLEKRRIALNQHYGTSYGWKLVLSHNVNRLFVGDVNTIDLHDSEPNSGDIRSAIREAIKSADVSRAPGPPNPPKPRGDKPVA